MHLRELIVENFKGFKGERKLTFDKDLTFFVGDNNSGKSSIFEALDFLKTGLPLTKKLDDLKNKNSNGDINVTVKLQEGIECVINDFSEVKYLPYVFKENGIETLIARRTSKASTIKQGKKNVEINIKKITLWNNTSRQFENPSGIDTVFKTLFETQFVWADTSPDEISDFGTTKICGRLLMGAIGDFFKSEQWDKFTQTHKETFHTGPNSLSSRTKSLEKRIQDILTDQYGLANVNFNFELPDVSSFIKSGEIDIDDGTKTSSKEKGTGMQRALALALIQVYADEICKHPDDPLKKKPLFLFIDEPETFLHPKAQEKLLEALGIISKVQQVFVTTHSPYLLKSFDPSRHTLYMCTKLKDTNEAVPSSSLHLFGKSSPTWGEINYFAYGLLTVEFHNELYGFVQAKATTIDLNNYTEEIFDNYLVSKKITKSKTWIRENKDGTTTTLPRTLQTYIRNYIHHPENTRNVIYTVMELKKSIEELLTLL